MIRHENHIHNIDVNDKYGVENDVVLRNLLCKLHHLTCINRKNEYGEDVDVECPPLAAAIIGMNNTAAASGQIIPKAPELVQTWTDLDEQQLYIDTKPNCYLIIAKPGAGAYSLGESLSKKLNLIHICPRNVILDEISQKSPTGTCLDFNMKHYNECKIDSLLPIIKEKLNSPAVRYRGYILSGIPLVTSSRSEMSYFKSLSSEEAVTNIEELLLDFVMNFNKKKKKPKKGTETDLSNASLHGEGEVVEEVEEEEEEQVQEEAEEEEDPAVELPKFLLEPCHDVIFKNRSYYGSKRVILTSQINQILKTELKPDIIIYITCPDEDLITIKSHKYLDYGRDAFVVDPFLSTPISTEQRWPPKYSMSDYDAPQSPQMASPFKYHVRSPINYTDNATNQLCNYRNSMIQFLERKIKDINPKLIIKVDARTSVHQMLYNISERLEVVPLVKRVILPEPLYVVDPPEEIEEFWKMVEESNTIKCNGVTFNRYASPWYTRCPVELKKRKSVRGKLKYAVSFFKHVYLLSSLDNLIMFWKDPRQYLNLHHLEPTCRIIVMGTKTSGKTMTAECLSWIFDAPILSYDLTVNKEKEKKYNIVAQSIFSDLIPAIEDARYENWQKLEGDRLAHLEEWHSTALANLRRYILVINDIEKHKTEPNPNQLTKLQNLQETLSFLPFLDDHQQCNRAFASKNIREYAPAKLTISPKMPSVPVLSDPDVTEAIKAYIVANNLQQDVDLTPEDIILVFKDIIRNIDKEAEDANSTYGKYIIDGFSPDPELWNYLADAKLLPDYTIAIIENREVDKELIENYRKMESAIKRHKERFLEASDPLIKIKQENVKHTNVIQKQSMSDFHPIEITKILDDSIRDAIHMSDKNIDSENAEEITAFVQSVENFRLGWESTKQKLEEDFKAIIEVEIENKTDIEILEEILLKLRQAYCPPCEPFESEVGEPEEEGDEIPKDLLTFNEPRFLCETDVYCPIAYYDYGVLWEGKSEFSIKYENKMHYFSKEECMEIFRKDCTKYLFFNKPFKKALPWRICVMGAVGSGKTTISRFLAKELGLIHIDYEDAVNNFVMPTHFKKVGRRYENRFTDINLEEEAVEAFQMGEETDESYITDILYNEKELRRMVYNYFEKGTPLLSVLVQKLLKRIWFEDPFINIGIVIDGFPKGPQDIEDMMACFCIPDLILELESSSEVAMERVAPAMFKTWKMQQNEAKRKERAKFNEQKQQWTQLITKNVVAMLMFEDILDEVMLITHIPVTQSKINQNELEATSNADQGVGKDEPNEPVEPFIVTAYNQMVEQYPEPVDTSEWENAEDARERIDGRIEALFEFDDENIQSLKELLSEQKIKIVSVDATKSINKVQRKALIKMSNLRNRAATFEQTWIIDCQTADALLSGGYYFLSKFSRICPVFSYENPNALLNPYKVNKRDNSLFPVVHRCYIYYIAGKESVKKFRTDPLKYIVCDNVLSFYEYPLRFAVIGPPKSGKSTLASKLANIFGLICVSKGMAIRNVLENMHWTKLATEMNKALNKGDCISYDLIIRAIQTALMDYRSAINGFVLDGFPDYPPYAMELEKDGNYPLVIFDLSTSNEKLIQNSQTERYNDILKYLPPYSQPYIEYRLSKWNDKAYAIRDFIKGDCQNLITLDGNESKWLCNQKAKDYITSITPKVHYYVANIGKKNLIKPAGLMCITNETFKKNMSMYENFCPLCLKNNVTKYSTEPFDKTGLVLFKGVFYWICSDHMNMALDQPEKHLASKMSNIPEIPAIVKNIHPNLVYENGICIVTYGENLPYQIIKTGSYKFAASYKKRIYLFCNNKCLSKFLEKPHLYFDITVFKGTKGFPQISLKKLPNIGYLEQSVGDLLTKACCAVNVVRPLYPGLSAEVSGILYVALYMKVNNPLMDKAEHALYKKVFKVYEARSKLLINVGLRLRSTVNPFATNYPTCCAFGYGRHRKHSDSEISD